MLPLSFIAGMLLGGLAMHVCLALESRCKRADYIKVRVQARTALNAWHATVDDFLRLRIGEREPEVAMHHRHNHVHEMLKLQGVLDETPI